MAFELIKSISIENLLRQREGFVLRVRQAEAATGQAKELYDAAGIGAFGLYESVAFDALGAHHFHTGRMKPQSTADELVKGFDAVAWKRLMRDSGLQTFMSSGRLAEWDKAIMEKQTAEFNMPNIESTFGNLLSQREAMMDEGIASVFRGLSWSHKTNLPVKFGKKIIISSAFAYFGSLAQDKTRLVDDLVRFLHVADKVPQPDHRDNFAALHTFRDAVAACGFQSPYIEVRGFKNGNLHILFKRLDLIDEMNKVIARRFPGALPAPKA